MKRFSLGILMAGMTLSVAHGDTSLINDDFEGYADTAAMQAFWTPTAGAEELYRLVDNSINPDAFAPGEQGVEHLGGPVALHDLADIAPSATQNVVLKFDIYDDASSANKRVTVGLRQDAGASNLFELGVNNAQSAPHYAARVLFPSTVLPPVTGSAQNWIAFHELVDDTGTPIDPPTFGSNAPVLGWHQMIAEFGETSAVIKLDLNRDGNINATHEVTYDPLAAGGWQQIRFGGPSALTSGGGSMIFDNIMLTLVDVAAPEVNADFNGNSIVDAADYVLWRDNFPLGSGATQSQGDADGDMDIDQADYDAWFATFGNNVPGSGQVVAVGAVPEPSTIVLLLMGLAALGSARRQR